jgi:hypothetical protein
MGKAKWWVCDSCKSLNDLPANKCYKCRQSKPKDPELIDDQYSKVGGGSRVSVSVDLSQVGDLTRPDPVETAEGGGLMEAFDTKPQQDPFADVDAAGRQVTAPRFDPYTGAPGSESSQDAYGSQKPAVRPLREPVKRGIDALGGMHWTFEDEAPQPPLPPPPTDDQA